MVALASSTRVKIAEPFKIREEPGTFASLDIQAILL